MPPCPSALIPLDAAPFGRVHRSWNAQFLRQDPQAGLVRGGSGGRVYSAAHYQSSDCLLALPGPRDEPPSCWLLFLHGHQTALNRGDLDPVLEQLSALQQPVALLAPQLAYRARDSSPGGLEQPGSLQALLEEADRASLQRLQRSPGPDAPLLIAAWSGGYRAAAHCLEQSERCAGLLLVDAVYGEVERLSRALRQRPRCKVLCCWGESTAAGSAALMEALGERAVRSWPAEREGACSFLASPHPHLDVLHRGPPEAPLLSFTRELLSDLGLALRL